MQFKIFTISVADDGTAIEEMNRFLRGHKVLEVEQLLISTKMDSQWHFCVKYLANAQLSLCVASSLRLNKSKRSRLLARRERNAVNLRGKIHKATKPLS
jgi:hypothetical protein